MIIEKPAFWSKIPKVYRDAADYVFIFHLFLCCFLRLGAFKNAREFLAALAGHLGFESLSQVRILRGSAQIFYKPVCQIVHERSRDM